MTSDVPRCPHCAGPGEPPLVCERCGWRWHANPYPAAAVLVERDADDEGAAPSVLLLRRAVGPGMGLWDLPAGYLEPHESAEQGARREAREESGLDVELVSLAGVYSSPAGNSVTSVFRAVPRVASTEVRLDHESSDFAWVARADVGAWLSRMAFPAMAAALADWAAGRIGAPSPD
jgi:ADP-ribose pyrophosphatase YjhB (NUDIX family)